MATCSFICKVTIFIWICFMLNSLSCEVQPGQEAQKPKPARRYPTVLIPLLVRNKAHILPLFLTYFQNIGFPKKDIALWIRSDHNSDSSTEILENWLRDNADLYFSVDFEHDDSVQRYQNESTPNDWPLERFNHIIQLKEEALAYGREKHADYIFFLDIDVLITHSNTLLHLIRLNKDVVAPMLLSEGLYSNFWCAMTPDYYYQRTDEYKEIYNVNKEGVFRVPMVHSAVLIRWTYFTKYSLTFDRRTLIRLEEVNINGLKEYQRCRTYDGPVDDIIVFAVAANCTSVEMYVSNILPYGYIMQPLDVNDGLDVDKQQLINLRANIVNDLGGVIPLDEHFDKYIYPKKTNITLDHIYMINLIRRPHRRDKMFKLFEEIGLDVEHFPAVDGKRLTPELLEADGIKFMPGYEDPYNHRKMTMGEVGCFLSHYRIWEKIVAKQQKEVLILEDDVRFQPYFKENAERVLSQIRKIVKYDLVYFGRKRLKDEDEPKVEGTENLVHVGYSYWTLGYVISLEGARKLLAANPLKNLLPVDEFLPIMYDRHPNETWKSYFFQRDLWAFSAAPLLLYPTHYTGEKGYISDTEDSEVTLTAKTNNAHLKSDRELEFPIPAETETKQQETTKETQEKDDFLDLNSPEMEELLFLMKHRNEL
ncbi:unnamed protein product [Ceratitis capitata]|uniref:(Mediterranean fruit fly) hypothetical protein n=1 Tax=Ceratitis capitata TaxID=7213 RepID=W8BMS1_CERCA|nr:unnamed protein product [Ceratitis capitata]